MKKNFFLFFMLFLFFTNLILSQEKIIKGIVTDTKKTPLFGVSVFEENTTNGVVTDFDGNYTLKVKDGSVIVFAYLGMVSKKVPLGSKTVINVVLEQDIAQLDEIVVVGYGSKKKGDITGSISTVELKDVNARSSTSASQILQGKLSGVSITQSSGIPGDDSSTIRIRGISSIDNNNDPLVIIDDIQGTLDDINPADIESISVLKDAASAAIYGTRASAGVILIKTKRAKNGSLSFDFNTITSIQTATRLPETLNSWEHAELTNEALRNVGQPQQYTREDIELYKFGLDPIRPNTDWYGAFLGNGIIHNHFLSVKQGSDNFKFTGSLGYYDQQGVLIGTNSDKLTYRTRFDTYFLNKKLKMGIALTGYDQNIDDLTSSARSVFSTLAATNSTTFVESFPDESGLTYFSGQGRYIGLKRLGGGIERRRKSLITQYYLQFEPINKLQLKVTYSNNNLINNYQRYTPNIFTAGNILANSVSEQPSSLEKSFSTTDRNTFFATLRYSKRFKGHYASVLLGYEKLERIYDYDYAKIQFLSTNQPIFDFGDPNTQFISSSANESATVSYFARVNYNYKYKYLLEFSFRRDGSSRFAPANQWGNFPSVSAGWKMSKEKFMKPLDYLDLKFRASWGRLGNQNIRSYYGASDQMSGSEFYSFGGSIVSGRAITVLADPNTKWETTEQTNIGFDLKLFNRFTATVDYFDKKTFDILARVTVPTSLGIEEKPYQNIGSMTNRGIDIDLGYTGKQKSDGLNYSINANFSYLENEVTDLGGLDFVEHSETLRSQVGQPFSSFFGYKVEGIYQVDDFTWQNNSDPTIDHYDRDYQLSTSNPDPSGILPRARPGDLKFKDVDGNGIVDPEDKTIIGSSVPKFYYGGTINLSYKRWGLNIIGQGVGGAQAYQSGRLLKFLTNGSNSSILRSEADNRWTFDNPSTTHRSVTKSLERDQLESDYYVHNASYFRVRNIQLTYNVDEDILRKVNIAQLRLFLSAENVFLITKYIDGFDPERPYNITTEPFHPQISSLSLGFNLKF